MGEIAEVLGKVGSDGHGPLWGQPVRTLESICRLWSLAAVLWLNDLSDAALLLSRHSVAISSAAVSSGIEIGWYCW